MARGRYWRIQSRLNQIGSEGCLFLSLCSVAEDAICKKIDLIDVINEAFDYKWIKPDYTVLDALAMLRGLTGRDWTYKRIKDTSKLPEIGTMDYTVEEWYNPATRRTHFKRRDTDTLEHSVTTANGYLQAYRVYTMNPLSEPKNL